MPTLPALLPRPACRVARQRKTVCDKRPVGGAVFFDERQDGLVFLGAPHASVRGQGAQPAGPARGVVAVVDVKIHCCKVVRVYL